MAAILESGSYDCGRVQPGEREEPVRWERGGHVGLRGGAKRAAARGAGAMKASHKG